MTTRPSIGRIVHYVSHGTPLRLDGTQAFARQCRAAIITEVHDDDARIGLWAINPTGQFWHSLADGGCEHDPGSELESDTPPGWPSCDGAHHEGGTWHWPARTDA